MCVEWVKNIIETLSRCVNRGMHCFAISLFLMGGSPLSAVVELTKTVNGQPSATVVVGDIVNFQTIINNDTLNNLENPIFFDPLPSGVILASPSNLQVTNATVVSGTNPVQGITLSTLLPDAKVVVSFDAQVVAHPTLSTSFQNISYLIFCNGTETGCAPQKVASNAVLVEVDSTPFLNITKSVSYPNQTCAQLGDTVTFTVLITNTGTGVAIAPWFIDPLPSGLVYETGSSFVSLNGAQFVAGGDPTVGFALPNLNLNDSVRLTFRATVATFPPMGNHFENIAEVIYCVDSENGCTVVSHISEKINVLVDLPSPIGCIETCRLIHRTVYTFTITWNIPFVNVQRYRVFFEGNLIEELPGGQPLFYRTRLCRCDPNQFSVQADYGSDNTTPVTPVRVE